MPNPQPSRSSVDEKIPDWEFAGRFEDRARGFIDWLLSMDDPEDVLGRSERQTVTLTKIIDRARSIR